jgi:methyl-accepting chemotaxis protein
LIEGFSEKFAKRLIGRTEMEDGLKRLDKLTQEEVRMATAQNLKVTHTVDKGVKEVVDTVVAIDDRVARVDDQVASVNDRVASVDNTVKVVDDRVKVVDDKVAEVIAGA